MPEAGFVCRASAAGLLTTPSIVTRAFDTKSPNGRPSGGPWNSAIAQRLRSAPNTSHGPIIHPGGFTRGIGLLRVVAEQSRFRVTGGLMVRFLHHHSF